jgi:hypothetical protein
METVTLTVASRTAVRERIRNAFAGKTQGAQIAFETPELLFEAMTMKRWEIVRALAGTSRPSPTLKRAPACDTAGVGRASRRSMACSARRAPEHHAHRGAVGR